MWLTKLYFNTEEIRKLTSFMFFLTSYMHYIWCSFFQFWEEINSWDLFLMLQLTLGEERLLSIFIGFELKHHLEILWRTIFVFPSLGTVNMSSLWRCIQLFKGSPLYYCLKLSQLLEILVSKKNIFLWSNCSNHHLMKYLCFIHGTYLSFIQ